MTIDDIRTMIVSDESRILELKKTTGELKDGMHSACAFLNTEGGWLIFGVTPKSLKIVGQEVTDNTQREIALALAGLEQHHQNQKQGGDQLQNNDNSQHFGLLHLFHAIRHLYHSTLHFTIIQRTLQEGMCCFMVVFLCFLRRVKSKRAPFGLRRPLQRWSFTQHPQNLPPEVPTAARLCGCPTIWG